MSKALGSQLTLPLRSTVAVGGRIGGTTITSVYKLFKVFTRDLLHIIDNFEYDPKGKPPHVQILQFVKEELSDRPYGWQSSLTIAAQLVNVTSSRMKKTRMKEVRKHLKKGRPPYNMIPLSFANVIIPKTRADIVRAFGESEWERTTHSTLWKRGLIIEWGGRGVSVSVTAHGNKNYVDVMERGWRPYGAIARSPLAAYLVLKSDGSFRSNVLFVNPAWRPSYSPLHIIAVDLNSSFFSVLLPSVAFQFIPELHDVPSLYHGFDYFPLFIETKMNEASAHDLSAIRRSVNGAISFVRKLAEWTASSVVYENLNGGISFNRKSKIVLATLKARLMRYGIPHESVPSEGTSHLCPIHGSPLKNDKHVDIGWPNKLRLLRDYYHGDVWERDVVSVINIAMRSGVNKLVPYPASPFNVFSLPVAYIRVNYNGEVREVMRNEFTKKMKTIIKTVDLSIY